MPFCPKCGNQLAEGAKFCTNCGNSLAAPATSAAPAPQQNVNPQPVYTQPAQPVYPQYSQPAAKKTNWTLAVILILVGLLIVGCVGAVIFDIADDGEFNLFGLLDSEPENNDDDEDEDEEDETKDEESDSTDGSTVDAPTGTSPSPDETVPQETGPISGDASGLINSQVVYDANGITLTATGYEEVDGYANICIEVTNSTNHNLFFYSQEIAFNGIGISAQMNGSCSAGATEQMVLDCELSLLEAMGLDSIHSIDCYFIAYETASYQTVIEDSISTIYTNAPNDTQLNLSGTTVLSEQGITVNFISQNVDLWDFSNFYFYAENHSGSDVYLTVNINAINGIDVSDYMWAELYNGSGYFGYAYFSNADLSALGIQSIDNFTITVSADYIEAIDYNVSLIPETDPITITLN